VLVLLSLKAAFCQHFYERNDHDNDDNYDDDLYDRMGVDEWIYWAR